MKQLELELEGSEYWKHKYDELMAQYIKLEEKLYNIRTSVALLRDVMLEHGKAG